VIGRIITGDALVEMAKMEAESVDTIITDPPYGLNPQNINKRVNEVFGRCFNIMLPNLDKANPKRVKYSDFVSILREGSHLGGIESLMVIDSWIGVPESPVDFDCNIEIRQKEINTGDITASFNVSNAVLVDKVDSQGTKFIGNYVLDFGDSVDFSTGNVLTGNIGEFSPGGLCVPISSIRSAFLPQLERDFPFPVNRHGILDLIWSVDNSRSNPPSPGFVLTSRGAEDQPMLVFNAAGRANDFAATITTIDKDRFGNFVSPELVRAPSITGGLPTELKPCRVSLILNTADGAESFCYLHLYLPKNLLSSINTILDKSSGFMGKRWDYEVPSVEVWAECLRVAKPGATLLCFAGTRTQHRMAVNIEDAGWRLVDCLMWLYGQGFPKAQDIGKSVNATINTGGSSPRNLRKDRQGEEYKPTGQIDYQKGRMFSSEIEQDDKCVGLCPKAQPWDGWKSHGLKPAYEPIILAMKPNDGSYADNALKHGVGGLWIDGGKIGAEIIPPQKQGKDIRNNSWSGQGGKSDYTSKGSVGRYPANVILDEKAARMLDEATGNTSQTGNRKDKHRIQQEIVNTPFSRGVNAPEYTDSGGASRFFYCAKASKRERGEGNTHSTVKPLSLMQYLCRLTKTPTGGIVLDPFCGSGSTLLAAQREGRSFIGIELNPAYAEMARRRIEADCPIFNQVETA